MKSTTSHPNGKESQAPTHLKFFNQLRLVGSAIYYYPILKHGAVPGWPLALREMPGLASLLSMLDSSPLAPTRQPPPLS
eukprot:3994438-Lingulodinium_polyedra.AAC.1